MQARLCICVMTSGANDSSTNSIIIRANGIFLCVASREFAIITSLNCVASKDDFVFDEDVPNMIFS